MKWSDDLIDKSISLLKEGSTYEEIGKLIGKTGHSVKCKMLRIGLKTSEYKIIEKHKEKKCLYCGNSITGYKNFCNRSCSAKYNNNLINQKREKKKCLYCGKEIKSRNIFCDNECQAKYYKEIYLNKWKNGENVKTCVGKMEDVSKYIRDYIFEKYDNKCAICGWNEVNNYTGKIPLQIEHIDGNYSNNNEKNLTLLCPNCHSLTPTYGSRNKGNGRKYRQKMRKEGNYF